MTVAYLGVGANLGHPVEQLQRARTLLNRHFAIQFIQSSSIYSSSPIGGAALCNTGQSVYVNAVWQIHTSLSAFRLLSVLNELELKLGRKRLRGSKNMARPLDLDILLYGNQRINTKNLIVPHPRLHLRRFVLEPLAEITSGLTVPGVGVVQYLAQQNSILVQAVKLLHNSTSLTPTK